MKSVHMRLYIYTYIHFCWHYYMKTEEFKNRANKQICWLHNFFYLIYIHVLESLIQESSDSN